MRHSRRAAGDAFAESSAGPQTRASAAVLGGDRPRVTSEQAAIEAGVSPAVGVRWFRLGGGCHLSPSAALRRYLSFAEREEIALLRVQDHGVREIARRSVARRRRSRVSCAVTRPRAAACCTIEHRPRSGMPICAPASQGAKLAVHAELRRYVQDRLSGAVQRPGGAWSRVRRSRGSGVGMARARTGGGARRGVLSRYRTACAWTSPMMSPCASLTRRSISRCSFRARRAAP